MENNRGLQLNQIEKTFGTQEVLRSVSLSVAPGEVVAIIGPSGSGKSTFLRCALLLEQIDSGVIILNGETIVEAAEGVSTPVAKNVLTAYRKKLGVVFQDFRLFPHFTVLRNVCDALVQNYGKSWEQAEKTGRALLTRMGLSGKENAYPSQLSGGEQQRVSIARALALEPEILFFDEPTSSLDPELTGEVLEVMRDLAAEKRTMVVVTHEIAFARHIADRVIFMDGGLVLEVGTPEEVLNNPAQERTQAFLGKLLHM